MTIKKLTAGDNQISASGWNDMRAFVHDFSSGQDTNTIPERNNVIVTVHNTTIHNYPAFSVVKVDGVTHTGINSEVEKKTLNYGVELNVSDPVSGIDNIAILQESIPAGQYGKALIRGCTVCKVQMCNSSNRPYGYAVPIIETGAGFESYQALKQVAHVTPIQILYHIADSDYCVICIGNDTRPRFYMPQRTVDITAGDVYHIYYNNTDNIGYPYYCMSTASTSSTSQLAVCQCDLPVTAYSSAGVWMPFYRPEDNIGVKPNITQGLTGRCGVLFGSHSFTNGALDYRYIDNKFVYEPVFTVISNAKKNSGGGLYVRIGSVDINVSVPSVSTSYSQPWIRPDIYINDALCVRVVANYNGYGNNNTYTATTIHYPVDFCENTIMSDNGNAGYPNGRRGWVQSDVISLKKMDDTDYTIFLYNKDKTDAIM